MHLIQRHILKRLTLEGRLRYSELKPKEIDGNQFMYHLGVVIKDGHVRKENTHYSLTMNGKMFADRVELETFLPREQPKIVTMIYATNAQNELLLFRRKRSPLHNLVHLPYGKLHMGEKTSEGARRELKEKTGLSGDLSHIGDIYVRVYDGDELIAHILHHMFEAKNLAGEMPNDTQAGTPFWARPEVLEKKEIVGGFSEMVDIVEKNAGKLFFEEFELRLKKNNPQT